MEIIVCTGDSHTCGQGADSIRTKYKPKNPNNIYNTAGKGISRGGDLAHPCYVNLLRDMVAQATGSEYALTGGMAIRAQTRYPLVNAAVKLEGEYRLPKGWQLHTICLMETTKTAQLGIYVDGRLVRREALHTPLPRYNEWSFRNICIRCEQDQQVTLKPVDGDVYISHIQHDKGAYAVINSGIGSCTTKRYMDEGFTYCVAEFDPAIVVAEAQTINDWIHYDSSETHETMLNRLLDHCKDNGAKLIYSTVAPIRGAQESKKFGLLYEDFIAASKRVGQRDDLLFADSHAAFCEEISQIPQEEQFDAFYVDNWHVNGRGHKLYADTIFAKLKEVL